MNTLNETGLFGRVKNLDCDTPLLDWLLSKYKGAEEIPTTNKINGEYGDDLFCQVFAEHRYQVKDWEKENIINDMIASHKRAIENAMIYNKQSGVIRDLIDSITGKSTTLLKNVFDLYGKEIKTYYSGALTQIKSDKKVEFGLIRMADDSKGVRLFRLCESDRYLRGELHLILTSDLGVTAKHFA